MRIFEIMRSNGTTQEFKAKNLREARKIAKTLACGYEGTIWLYEGYSNMGFV